MNTILPFEGFLQVLREKGYAVGVRDHLALARLLERWDRTSPIEFRDAVAALIGRSDEEVDAIRRLFDEVYTPRAASPESPASEPSRKTSPVAVWGWALATAAGLLVVTFIGLNALRAPLPGLPPRPSLPRAAELRALPVPETTVPPVPTTAPPARPTVSVPPPTPPDLPAAPAVLARATALQVAAGCLLLTLSWFWHGKSRAATTRWLRDSWRATLGALPGPHRFDMAIAGLSYRLPRFDVEDAAVTLGRIFSVETYTRDIDVGKSLRLTLRRGLFTSLVFKPLRTARAIVVLQDIGLDMEIWRGKVEAFLADLSRQGIALERWYFDADIQLVSDRPRGPLVPFASLVERRIDSPFLIVSTGAGLLPLNPRSEEAWKRPLRTCVRRTWLTPVTDSRLWPEPLERVPVRVWPMNRHGLTQAARDLAGFEILGVRNQGRGDVRVTSDHIERLKRLASIVPHPTLELLEFLRQRFAPDVPDATLAHLVREARAEGLRVLRLDDAELQRCLAAVRSETPQLEAAVRAAVLTVLRDSKPPDASAAHLRWEMSVALQELSLARLQNRDASQPIAALQRLAQGPLWEEVRSAAGLVLKPLDGPQAVGATLGRLAGAQPPSDDGKLARLAERPRAWPGLRELVGAGTATFAICLVAWLFGLLPARTLAHVQNAYGLAFVESTLATPPALELRMEDTAQPSTVGLYQDGVLFRPNVAIPPRGASTIALSEGETGKYYQVRAVLPAGNLAVSNPVWVPSAETVVVLVDAQPWARVIITGTDIKVEAQATPFRVSLRPGPYTLQFENGGVTAPMTQQVTVTPATTELRYAMPGFNADETAATLVR